jgi:hypothetical protein
MKNKNLVFVVVLIIGILLCTSIGIWFNLHPPQHENGIGTCPAVPAWFSKADLIGTWVAQEYVPITTTDTLIIGEDGKYKQIIHIDKKPPVDYESDWQPWSVEYGKKGLPFLYLKNYRICAANQYYDCFKEYDLGSPDCCNDLPHKSQTGELALTVVGMPNFVTPSGTPAGDLRLLLFRGCELSAWGYRLQQP